MPPTRRLLLSTGRDQRERPSVLRALLALGGARPRIRRLDASTLRVEGTWGDSSFDEDAFECQNRPRWNLHLGRPGRHPADIPTCDEHLMRMHADVFVGCDPVVERLPGD